MVRDTTSDFVQISKKGSALLKQVREQQDRSAMREKFWDLAGSKMGNLMKVKAPQQEVKRVSKEDDVDYKADN